MFPSASYDDPNKVPMLNGPIRIVTPPATRPTVPNDSRIFEFLIPQPMHIVDQVGWPNLQFQVGGISAELLKPVVALGPFEPADRLGNEAPELFCTMLRCLVIGKGFENVLPEAIWPVLESALAWIRVRARHYWLLHGSTGYGASYRGSILQNQSMSNFAAFGATVLVRPFTRDMWVSLGNDISSGSTPPVSESIFCDGLLSAVAGDEMKALLELGVACEIELTQLLDAAARSGSPSKHKAEFLADKGDWDRFRKKLKTWPPRLGLDDVSAYPTAGIPPNWVEQVEELYGLRGGVAHSGKKKAGGASVQSYMFSANALFRYSLAQKVRAGLQRYPLGPTENPIAQLVAYRDNLIFARSNQGSQPVDFTGSG